MTRQRAVQRLFHVWLFGAIVLAIILAVQAFAGKYGGDEVLAWSWYMSIVTAPTTLVTVAAFVDPKAAWRDAFANDFKYKAALWLSLGLLFLAIAALFLEPLVTSSSYELFAETGILIGFLQAAVVAAVGSVVFDKR